MSLNKCVTVSDDFPLDKQISVKSLQTAYTPMLEIILHFWTNIEFLNEYYTFLVIHSMAIFDINYHLDFWSTSRTWRSVNPPFQCSAQTLFLISNAALWTQTIQIAEIRVRGPACPLAFGEEDLCFASCSLSFLTRSSHYPTREGQIQIAPIKRRFIPTMTKWKRSLKSAFFKRN